MYLYHFHLRIASVVRTFISISHVSSFDMGSVAHCIRWSFGLSQGVIFVLMSFYYHVNMYHTHSKIFKRCHTSVVTAITKCIFSVALGQSHRKVVALKVGCSYVLNFPCHIVK